MSKQAPALLDEHLEHLLGSGISLDVILDRGYISIFGKAPLKAAGYAPAQRRAPGILIPTYGPDGLPAGSQYRPDNPRTGAKDKPVKYETPGKSSLRLDMPPRCQKDIGNPGIPLWITEGAKKIDALASRGACALSLNGVWGFKGRNEFGATVLLADFDYVAWKDRRVYLAFDADAATNHQVRKALERLAEHVKRRGGQIQIINLPMGDDGAKTGVDDYLAEGHTLDDLLALATDDMPEEDTEPMAFHSQLYCIHEGQYCVIKDNNGVKHKAPLCNFVAAIDEEVIRDDGLGEVRYFNLSGQLRTGIPLPPVEIPVETFNTLSWVTPKWGARALINPGSTTKDHLRYMIQSTMNGVEPRRVFTHTGWRELNGERFFLSGSGAVGREGIEVTLGGNLAKYQLPQDPSAVAPIDAARASVRFMDFGRDEVMVPLWATMYLSPLAELLNPAFTLWLQGSSGSFKSVLTALALCHFGEFDYLNLPASWRDTANRLELTMFTLKDMPLVIDDWHPAPTPAGQKEMDSKAEMVVRGQGNKSGRGRLRSDATARDTYYPRGMAISSGEQVPGGESHAARLFVLDLEKTDTEVAQLSLAQKESRNYAYAMAHYILWLQTNWGRIKEDLPAQFELWRDRALAEGNHLRLPAAVAWLYAGLDLGLSFALEVGAITPENKAERMAHGWKVLTTLALRQGAVVNTQRAAARFLDALESLMDTHEVFVVYKDDMPGSDPKPGQKFVGWYDEDYYYLLPSALYIKIHKECNGAGVSFTFKPEAVWADLRRLGLTVCQAGRHQNTVRVGSGLQSEVKRVVQLKKEAIKVRDEA